MDKIGNYKYFYRQQPLGDFGSPEPFQSPNGFCLEIYG